MPQLPKHDPKSQQLASREYINAKRDALEVAPVSVDGYLVDCKPVPDEERMRNALDLWDQLGQSQIAWTMADNSVHTLSQYQLQGIYDNMRVARGLRSLALHTFAAQLKQQLPNLTERQVEAAPWPT